MKDDLLEIKDVKVLTSKELQQLGLKGCPRKRFRFLVRLGLVGAGLYCFVFFVGLWVSVDYLLDSARSFFEGTVEYLRIQSVQ
jgi:hypothetical protein